MGGGGSNEQVITKKVIRYYSGDAGAGKLESRSR